MTTHAPKTSRLVNRTAAPAPKGRSTRPADRKGRRPKTQPVAPLVLRERLASGPDVARLETGFREALDALVGYEVPLTMEQRRAAHRWSPGFEVVVDTIVSVAPRCGIHIVEMPLEEMQARFDEATRLEGALATAREAVRTLEDRVRAQQGQAMTAALTYYGALSRLSRSSPKVHDLLAPARAFFTSRNARRGRAAPASGEASTDASPGQRDEAAPKATQGGVPTTHS